jgi:divalent anion:Na+ symporter, DASS family
MNQTSKCLDNSTDILLSDDIFAKSQPQSLARLLAKVSERQIEAGETVYQLGDSADYCYLINEGQVKLTSSQGRETFIQANRFGEEAGSDSENYLTHAVAETQVRLLQIPRNAMKEFVKENPLLKTDFMFSLTNNLTGEKFVRTTTSSKVAIKTRLKINIIIGWLCAFILPLIILVFGHKWELESSSIIFLAIFSATVSMWVFSVVDDYIPGLFALLATLITGLVPAPVILSGFASDGFLMALSTLAFGTVVVSSGLSYRIMLTLLAKLPNSQFWHNASLYALGLFLTPIIPTANGRVALVSPFFADMVESLQLKFKGLAATRLALSCFGSISLFSAVFLTSKSVNFAVFGLLTPQEQDHFQWVTWCWTAIVAGAVLLCINALVTIFWFRNSELPHLPKARVVQQIKLLGPIKNREWAAIIGSAFLIVGLVTSSIHKVQPPWLGFAMLFGLLLFGTLNKTELKEKVDWVFLLYLSGITGMVAVFNYLGLDRELGNTLPSLGEYMRTNFYLFVFLLFIVINLIRIAVPINATIVILASILMPVAEVNGINAWVVGFIILMFAESWFMPYQCSYYLQLQSMNQKNELYNEKSFLLFNGFMNFAKLAAIYASIPFWKMLGIL